MCLSSFRRTIHHFGKCHRFHMIFIWVNFPKRPNAIVDDFFLYNCSSSKISHRKSLTIEIVHHLLKEKTGLSFSAFLGIASRHSDLRTLKKFAINSIRYSSLNDKEKRDAFAKWQIKWDKFIGDLIHNQL